MAKKAALILGRSYSFTDLTITYLGIELVSCTNLVLKRTTDKANNMGLSNEPVSRGRKGAEYEASIDLSGKDMERLAPLSPTGLIDDLPMGPLVVLQDNGTDKHQWTALNFEFSDEGLEISDGDTESRRTYAAIFAGLDSRKLA